MKLLIIHSPFMPVHIGGTNFGGVEVYVDSIARCAHDNGDEVTVIVTEDSTCNVPGINILKVPSVSKFELDKAKERPNQTIRFPYHLLNKVIVEAGINNYDLVINNLDKAVVNRFLSNLQNKLKVRNVVSYIHNPPIFRGSLDDAKKFNDLCPNNLYFFNSNYNYEAWKEIATKENHSSFLSRMCINYLRVDINPEPPIDKFNPKVLIAIGRITEHKGFLDLKKIAQNNPDYQCHVLGRIIDQEYYDKLVKDKPENFHIHLDLSDDEKNSLIKSLSGWMCSFSCNETYGITAAEGFSLGMPLFVFDKKDTNIPFFIKHNEQVVDNGGYLESPIGVMIKRGMFSNDNIRKAIDNFSYNQKGIIEYFEAKCEMNYSHIKAFYEPIEKRNNGHQD